MTDVLDMTLSELLRDEKTHDMVNLAIVAAKAPLPQAETTGDFTDAWRKAAGSLSFTPDPGPMTLGRVVVDDRGAFVRSSATDPDSAAVDYLGAASFVLSAAEANPDQRVRDLIRDQLPEQATAITDRVRLLERADEAKARALSRLQERSKGTVTLDRGTGATVTLSRVDEEGRPAAAAPDGEELVRLIRDPYAREARWRTFSRVQPDLFANAQQFDTFDIAYLETGIDMVASAEAHRVLGDERDATHQYCTLLDRAAAAGMPRILDNLISEHERGEPTGGGQHPGGLFPVSWSGARTLALDRGTEGEWERVANLAEERARRTGENFQAASGHLIRQHYRL
jgi:hypothetical protein